VTVARTHHGGRRRPNAVIAILGPVCLTLAGCSASGGRPATSADVTPTRGTGGAAVHATMAYATGSPRQTLDLYLPAGDDRAAVPMAVLIHGGGFLEGSSQDMAGLARKLVAQGVAAASVNYRLAGDAPFPAGVQDVAAAVRYLRAGAAGWGVDPDRFATWGESAGGYLAAMIGVTGGTKTFDDPALGNPGVSSAVQAVVDWYGLTDFSTIQDQSRAAGCGDDLRHDTPDSPESQWLGGTLADVPELVARSSIVRQVGSATSLPPFLIVHGTKDCTVPAGQSQQLRDALVARGARVTLDLVDGAAHNDPRILEGTVEAGLAFLRSAWGGP
jgi:acetyl esterase/lipase